MPEIKAILFDNDGTVLDTHDLLLDTFRYATRTVLGREIPDEKLMAKVGLPLDVEMWDFTDDEAVHDELVRVYRAYNLEKHDSMVRLFDGVAETLEALRGAGFSMGIVTSKRHDPAQHGLELFDVMKYFDCLIGADDFEEHKPQPGPVIHAAGLLGFDPEECIYVGDSPFDMRAGSGAGCMAAAALWGMHSEASLRAQGPDFICTAFPDLLAIDPVASRMAR